VKSVPTVIVPMDFDNVLRGLSPVGCGEVVKRQKERSKITDDGVKSSAAGHVAKEKRQKNKEGKVKHDGEESDPDVCAIGMLIYYGAFVFEHFSCKIL
jgi:hypothetical protein